MRLRAPAFVCCVVALAACTRTPPNVPKSVDTASPGRCAAVDVATEPDIAKLLAKTAAAFNGSRAAKLAGGDCAFVRVQPVGPGNVFGELLRGWTHTNVFGPAPSMWMPGATAWITRLDEQHAGVTATARTSFVRTPLVVATRAPAPQEIRWAVIASKPFFKGNPLTSTTGLLATLAAPRAVARSLETSVAYYTDDSRPITDAALPVVTSARAVDEYNRAHPRTRLAAMTPVDGRIDLDYPLATIDAPWVSPRARAGAAAFASFVAARGARPEAPRPVTPTLDAWQRIRKPARLIVLFDVSESMNDPADPNDDNSPSKLTSAKAALLDALALLGPNDEVGLRIFTTKLPPPAPYWQDVVPMGRYADVRDRLARAVGSLRAGAGSPLYDATRATFDTLAGAADPSHIDGIVLLTDGYDEVHADRGALLAHLHPPVRIFAIPYSKQADADTLKSIAAATGAQVCDASDPRVIRPAFACALSPF